ncbi:hypothetical protein CARUB_v10018504mg [Capsella rubella]|uniref:Defensin-like protein n=1 Tax=Capsella rubella TaxID=81985 RepID=R0HMM4_9BRAS|nr:defensin-like protein 206 [Capsella rubella]EOA25193.1 hypothetical protein CARUB_v10018504mg [Capsella rubella]
MAKNLINSFSFTVLLVVLLMASTGILKTNAQSCGAGGCTTAASRVFLGECPSAHGTTNANCCTCCIGLFGSPPVCWAVIEGTDLHCHCYKKA